MLALDACYLALGLVLQPAEAERSNQLLAGLLSTYFLLLTCLLAYLLIRLLLLLAGLQRHCAEAAPAHAHLLRRCALTLTLTTHPHPHPNPSP